VKVDPFTVSMKLPAPAVALAGERELMDGTLEVFCAYTSIGRLKSTIKLISVDFTFDITPPVHPDSTN
jgi:hypothetical protein